jgi:hypothetical protein
MMILASVDSELQTALKSIGSLIAAVSLLYKTYGSNHPSVVLQVNYVPQNIYLFDSGSSLKVHSDGSPLCY